MSILVPRRPMSYSLCRGCLGLPVRRAVAGWLVRAMSTACLVFTLSGTHLPAAFAQDTGQDVAPAQGDTPPGELLPGITSSEIEEIRSTLGEGDQDDPLSDLDADEETRTPFRIGIVPRQDPGRFLKRLEPMRAGLHEVLGRPVEILPMASFSAMINAHTLRRIDLGFYSASAFVTADRLCRCIEPLVLPLADDGTSSYYAVIVTRQDSGLRDLAALEGKRIVASAEESVAGYRVQMASLISDGIDVQSYFGQIRHAVSSVQALRDLRDGLADAAFVWSSMAGEQSNGYSRGPLAFMVGAGELDMNQIAIIWQSKPIAHAPVAILKSVPAEERQIVRTFLLAMPESDTASYDLIDVYYGGGYRAAGMEDFRGIGIVADVDLRALSRPPGGSAAGLSETSEDRAAPLPRPRPDPLSLQ